VGGPDVHRALTRRGLARRSTERSVDIARYSNPAVDRLLDDARATTDRGRRLRIYRDVSRIVTRDAAWIFLFQSVLQVPHRRWVQGYDLPLIGVANLYPVDVAK
jgi:ABC-type transport system substrate-binding protein